MFRQCRSFPSNGVSKTSMNDSSLLCARRADTRIPLPRYVASDRRTSASNYRRPNYDGFYTSVMEQKINCPQDGDPMADAAPGDKKGGVIFYSRLAGYPENKPSSDKARMYAGIVVPARPDEPLNCCQSGCVHCVWDIYREDIEHYQTKRDEARQALTAAGKTIPQELGGSEQQPDIIGQLDPALQAFIKLEKQLNQKRLAREQTA